MAELHYYRLTLARRDSGQAGTILVELYALDADQAGALAQDRAFLDTGRGGWRIERCELLGGANPRLAELKRRAEAGDRFALAAVKAYATDAELEAAEAKSAAQDFTR